MLIYIDGWPEVLSKTPCWARGEGISLSMGHLVVGGTAKMAKLLEKSWFSLGTATEASRRQTAEPLE